MELRLHNNDVIETFEISDDLIGNLLDQVVALGMSQVSQIPTGISSIKVALRMGMLHNGIKNPDPKHTTDIEFVAGIMREKVIGYLQEKGLDAVGVRTSETRDK